MKHERGFTLLELVVSMAVFGIFLAIVGTVTLEMRGQEKRHPVNFMQHPQAGAVLTRLRRDVLDATGPIGKDMEFYPQSYPPGSEKYKQSSDTLIISTLVAGGVQYVIWDFSEPGVARRISYNVGVPTEWVARGLPPGFDIQFDAVDIPGHPYGVRVKAVDQKGMLSIDQYLQPRKHE